MEASSVELARVGNAGSRAASATIHRVMDVEHGLGNVTSKIMLATLLNQGIKNYGKPETVRTDPEGAFRDQGFRRGLAAKSIRLDIDPGEASSNVKRISPDTAIHEQMATQNFLPQVQHLDDHCGQ